MSKWVALADRLLNEGYELIQSNIPGKEPSLGRIPSVPTPSFRDMCLLVLATKFVITTEGGVHHAAGALNKEAIVIYGGRSSPANFHYPNHHDLYIDAPESPCGMVTDCEHCRECMDKITIDDVMKHVQR